MDTALAFLLHLLGDQVIAATAEWPFPVVGI
jgi:hypothetical protein